MNRFKQTNKQTNNIVIMTVIIMFMVILMPDIAFAQNNGNTPMGEVLCSVVGFVYGNLGKGLATIAIIIIGIGAMLGKTSWGLALIVGTGVGTIFGAQTILLLLIGEGDPTTWCI